MEKKINIKFDNTIVRISGNQYGQNIYEEFVEPYIPELLEKKEKYIIVFPQNIEYIGSSFIQGFMKKICMKIKKERFYEYFEIEGSDKLIKDFKEGLFEI